jgi:uncharacterized protein YkwD
VRLRRYGAWRKSAGENIAFGPLTGRSMVLQLLVDDGVPGREHRKNLFKASFSKLGVGCGPHQVYGTVCVLDLAGDYEEGRGSVDQP